MNFVLNSIQAKEVDLNTIKEGISSLELIRKASLKIYKYIDKNYGNNFNYLLLTGSGNNGGDVFSLAKLFIINNYNFKIYEVLPTKSKDIIEIRLDLGSSLFLKDIKEYEFNENTIIIDGVFGYGLNKPIDTNLINIFSFINSINKKLVISIDIASGISSNNGLILGGAIKSDLTLSIDFFKLGHFLNDGKDFNKEVVLLKIGLILQKGKEDSYIKRLDFIDYKKIFKENFIRKENSNKGSYGKISFIGGSLLTPGSIKLSLLAFSSLRLGVGYSEIIFPRGLNKEVYSLIYPELILNPVKSIFKKHIKFKKSFFKKLLTRDLIVLGMGMGVNLDTYKIIKYLLKNYEKTLIIDADGLNSLAKYGIDILLNNRCKVILTPHMKEFSRLINIDLTLIKADRIYYVKEFVNKYNLYLVLKDNSTLVCSKNKIYIESRGTNSLSKGGSGDLLSGIIGGCLVKKENNIEEILTLAIYILNEASKFAKIKGNINNYSLVSSDIVNYLNEVINNLIG